MQTQLITLTTDFGTSDGSIVLLKSFLRKSFPNAQFEDISHQVKTAQFAHAAYLVENLFPHFPPETIHLLLVNVYANAFSELKIVNYQNQYFVGFDNGLFSYLFDDKFVTHRSFGKMDRDISFHDFIIKGMNEIANAANFNEIANASSDLVVITRSKVNITESGVKGQIILFNDFGNAITNIHKTQLESVLHTERLQINFGYHKTINKISQHIFDVADAELVAYFNQFNYLEIAIRNHNINKLLSLKEGNIVKIDIV